MTRFMLVTRCGDCGEPVPFDICIQLGHNPGVDGHLSESRSEAELDLATYDEVAPDGEKSSDLGIEILEITILTADGGR